MSGKNILLLFPVLAAGVVSAAEADGRAGHRTDIFVFTEKPGVVRDGDTVAISFASEAYCDVTVAIEDRQGRIVRHLASGVLGPNAPAPFRKNALKQTVLWDSKNDRDEYVVDRSQCTVRVSLGLKPRFERTLYWSPYKLGFNGERPTFCAAPEGVYVWSGGVGRANFTPWLKLFDHDGRYVRTLYPFPASELERVQGLTWTRYPPDGREFALKNPPESQTSLLPWPALPGSILGLPDTRMVMVQDKDYVYLVGTKALRIAKTGSRLPSAVEGPELTIVFEDLRFKPRHYPAAVALSPDGKWLYLTGYSAFYGKSDVGHGWPHYLPCVMRMPSDCSSAPKCFLGEVTGQPAADAVFSCPSGIAIDGAGRLYVADMEKGLLIFSPEGEFLDRVDADSPAHVQVDPESGDIWAAGWILAGAYGGPQTGRTAESKAHVMLYRFTPYRPGRPPILAQSFVLGPDIRAFKVHDYSVMLDFLGDTKRVWLANAVNGWGAMGSGRMWEIMNARILEIGEGRLKELASFEALATRDVAQSRPPRYGRQRPYANPADGCVYIAEQIQPTVVSDVQCFDQLVKIDPESGRTEMVSLPFDSEDLVFDANGLAYLRTESIVARYESKTWREVPSDYGEELSPVTHYGLKPAQTLSSLYFRGGRGASGKLFGMSVNAKGDLACSFYSTSVSSAPVASENPEVRKPEIHLATKDIKPWKPRIFPGRSTYAFVHIWDRHGKLKFEDAVPGLGEMSDFKIDRDDNLYMVSNMMLKEYGKTHSDRFINTLVKMPAGHGRILTDGTFFAPVPLTDKTRPDRPPDAVGFSGYRGNVWLEGAEWALGGIGGNPRDLSARACHCEANVQLALDDYGRSFVPALHRYEVAVIDAAGNGVMRIGRYGNVEDGMPLIRDGGPPDPRSIGGDEVALVSPKWLSVLTDRRLFVSDRGNYRFLSIRLGYHAEERVGLAGVGRRPEATEAAR